MILHCFSADESVKVSLFKNGLDAKYYSVVVQTKFESYQKVKNAVLDFYARAKEDAVETTNIFRAQSGS